LAARGGADRGDAPAHASGGVSPTVATPRACSRIGGGFVGRYSRDASALASDDGRGDGELVGRLRARSRLAEMVRGDEREAARRLDGERSARLRTPLRALREINDAT